MKAMSACLPPVTTLPHQQTVLPVNNSNEELKNYRLLIFAAGHHVRHMPPVQRYHAPAAFAAGFSNSLYFHSVSSANGSANKEISR